MEEFLIITIAVVIFAVTKWYRGRDKPLDPDLFDSHEKKDRRENFYNKWLKGIGINK